MFKLWQSMIKYKGQLLVFAAGLLWGIIGVFVKELENCGSTPQLTGFLRVFFAFLIMLFITVFRYGFHALHTDKRTLAVCMMLGIVCHGIYNIFYSLAVTLAGVSVSAVLLNLAPICTLLFSVLCFSERMNRYKLAAVVINVAGCILAVTGGKFETVSFSVIGILCGIGAGLCYSMTAIIGRFAADRTNPFLMSMYSYFFAAVLLGIWMQPWKTGFLINSRMIGLGFLYALIPTAFAYVLYYRGLQEIRESSKVPVIASVETVVAVAAGMVWYQEKLEFVSGVGVCLVLFSIVMMSRGRDSTNGNNKGRTLSDEAYEKAQL